MSKLFFVAVGLACLATAPLRAATLYDCKVDATRANGIIQPEYYVVLDEAKGVAKVADGVIQTTTGKDMIDAEIKRNDASTLAVIWSLHKVRDGKGQDADLDFRAEISKADNSFGIAMKPQGYDNRFFYRGKCSTRTVKLK